MAGIHPSKYRPELTDERLRVVAELLLDVYYDTEQELSTPLDDNYTRACTSFGRQRNAILQLWQQAKYPWLQVTHAAMDITFEIGGVPCRFFADDPNKPQKPGFFRRSATDQLFPIDSHEPVLFRFIVAKPYVTHGEADVLLIGYDECMAELCRWQHSRSIPSVRSMDEDLPAEVQLAPAKVQLRLVKSTPENADTGS